MKATLALTGTNKEMRDLGYLWTVLLLTTHPQYILYGAHGPRDMKSQFEEQCEE